MQIITNCFLVIAAVVSGQALAEISVSASAELGALGVHQHKIRFGKDGTRFDYRNDGSQDVLYPFQRFSAHLNTESGASWELVYNPLLLVTKTTLKQSTRIDGTDFSAGTPMDLTYSFPFYRVSYCAAPCNTSEGLFYGGGLQIRNASIIFEDRTTNVRVVKQNVGPVPLIKLGYAMAALGGRIVFETDSMYAPVKVLNGSDSDVVGGFSDTHLSYIVPTSGGGNFGVRLRYLGGGAQGTNENDRGGSDGYTSNWIDLAVFSLRFSHPL